MQERYDNKFKINFEPETKKAALHTGKDSYASISILDSDVLIEDGKGDTLTIELNEARMFQQALQFIINSEHST